MYRQGQKLICIKKGIWRGRATRLIRKGPAYLENVTLIDVIKEPYYNNITTFVLLGYEGRFNSKWFRPPVNISQEVKNSFPEVIEETIDIPTLEPTS